MHDRTATAVPLAVGIAFAIALIALPSTVRAEGHARSLVAAPSAPAAIEARLHPTVKRCGKKWHKAMQALSEEQRHWLARSHHEIYRVADSGRTVLAIELLSTPSLRSCDPRDWKRRETTVRLTYFLLGGGTKVKQHYFTGEVMFDRQPKVHAAVGRALFTGATFEGERASRWVPLELLPDLLRNVRLAASQRPARVVASY